MPNTPLMVNQGVTGIYTEDEDSKTLVKVRIHSGFVVVKSFGHNQAFLSGITRCHQQAVLRQCRGRFEQSVCYKRFWTRILLRLHGGTPKGRRRDGTR
jgi:hypothetical protein